MVRFRFRFGRNVPEDVRNEMRGYLFHKQLGWPALDYDLVEVTNTSRKCDVVIRLQHAVVMDVLYGKIPRLRGMSVTDSGARPMRIDIHATNWFTPPNVFRYNPALSLTRDQQYHCYVVQHEMGHALGYGHSKPLVGQACPVMYQQTKGTGGAICVANPWPAVRAE